MSDTSDANCVARVAAALVAAIAEAQALVAAGELGPPLVELLRHAREIYELMRETLVADPVASGYARGRILLLGS